MKAGLAALVVLALAGPAHATDPFQGTAVFHATVDGKSMDFRFSTLGGHMRQEVSGPSGVMAVVLYDSDKGEMTTLVPQQKKYMTMKLSDLPAEAMTPGSRDSKGADNVTVTPTGEHAKIAGIACDGYLFKTPSGTVDICSAKGMGTFGGMQSPRGGGPSPAFSFMNSKNPAMARFAKDGFFPLRMKVQGADGKVMTWEATSVDRTRPDASIFAPPSDYSPIDARNMMPPH